MTSEFVYIRATFNMLLSTKGSSSSIPGLDWELASRLKVAALSKKFQRLVQS